MRHEECSTQPSAGLSGRSAKASVPMSEMVCLNTYDSRNEAEFDRAILEGAGIRALVSADDCGGMRPHLVFSSGGVKLLVLSESLERAAALLQRSEGELDTDPQ